MRNTLEEWTRLRILTRNHAKIRDKRRRGCIDIQVPMMLDTMASRVVDIQAASDCLLRIVRRNKHPVGVLNAFALNHHYTIAWVDQHQIGKARLTV